LAFAADPGSFAALCCEDVGMAGVGVAPAQPFLQLAGQAGVVRVFEFAIVKMRSGPNCASIGFAQEALVGVRHSSTLLRAALARIIGVLFADRLSRMT
jgi:hypothetical protein